MVEVKIWLINWFQKKSNMDKLEITNNTKEDYFSQKWIDSLKFYGLITDIENEFKIRFSNEDFQDRKFATIDGLTEIIEAKINAE